MAYFENMTKIVASRVKKNDAYPDPYKPPFSPFSKMSTLNRVINYLKKNMDDRLFTDATEISKLLDDANLFQDMKKEDDCINEITYLAQLEVLEKDTIIYKQGLIPDSFYLVLTGEVGFYMFKHNDYATKKYAPFIDKKDNIERHKTVNGIMTSLSLNLANIFVGGIKPDNAETTGKKELGTINEVPVPKTFLNLPGLTPNADPKKEGLEDVFASLPKETMRKVSLDPQVKAKKKTRKTTKDTKTSVDVQGTGSKPGIDDADDENSSKKIGFKRYGSKILSYIPRVEDDLILQNRVTPGAEFGFDDMINEKISNETAVVKKTSYLIRISRESYHEVMKEKRHGTFKQLVPV